MKNTLTNTNTRIGGTKQYKAFSRNTFNAALAAAVLVTISACGEGGATGDAPSGPTADSPMSGVWEKCLGGFKSTYTFTSNTWSEQMEFFQGENCTGGSFDDSDAFPVFGGSYEVIGNATSEGGLPVMQISMTSETVDGFAVFDSARVTRRNIVYTGTPNQLVFGEFAGSEQPIPTQLNFEEPYLLR